MRPSFRLSESFAKFSQWHLIQVFRLSSSSISLRRHLPPGRPLQCTFNKYYRVLFKHSTEYSTDHIDSHFARTHSPKFATAPFQCPILLNSAFDFTFFTLWNSPPSLFAPLFFAARTLQRNIVPNGPIWQDSSVVYDVHHFSQLCTRSFAREGFNNLSSGNLFRCRRISCFQCYGQKTTTFSSCQSPYWYNNR